jgi:hypothetical protein
MKKESERENIYTVCIRPDEEVKRKRKRKQMKKKADT